MPVRPKGQPPDVNFGVCNWAQRRKNKTSRIPTDEELGTIVGSAALQAVNRASWLEIIKHEMEQKCRRALETDSADFSGSSSGLASAVLPLETTHGPFALPDHVLLTRPYPRKSVDPATFHPQSPSLRVVCAFSKPTSSTSPPTQEDARLALETLLKFAVRQGLVTDAEYQTVVNLTERLRC